MGSGKGPVPLQVKNQGRFDPSENASDDQCKHDYWFSGYLRARSTEPCSSCVGGAHLSRAAHVRDQRSDRKLARISSLKS
jgi:hypothetical protein